MAASSRGLPPAPWSPGVGVSSGDSRAGAEVGSERQRSLLPLPLPDYAEYGRKVGLSTRSSRRRSTQRRHHHRLVADVILALNELDSGGPVTPPTPDKLNLMQELAIEHISLSCAAMGRPPSDMRAEDALRELQANTAYGSEEPVTLAPLCVASLSLPAPGSRPQELSDLLGEGGSDIVQQFCDNKILPKQVAEGDMQASGFKRPYLDPHLRDKKVYLEFLRRLLGAGLLDLVGGAEPGEVVAEVGAFAVHKKNGSQRLVIDARASNFYFAEPDAVHLATGSSLALLELPEGSDLWIAAVDIADAFYNMSLPVCLRRFFVLPRFRAHQLSITEVGGTPVRPGDWIYPRLAALPMGWSHALWFCQQVHERAIDGSSLSALTRIVDHRPPPSLEDGAHAEYVDNNLCFSLSESKATRMIEEAAASLGSLGLPLHPIEKSSTFSHQLGWTLDGVGGTVRPRSERIWRLRLATFELIKRGRASGSQVEKLVGHFTFMGLCRRVFLSIFDGVYRFIAQHRYHCRALPAGVARELRWAASLLPMLCADLRSQWLSRAYATDASENGRGVVQKNLPASLISSTAKHSDRWRYCDTYDSNKKIRPRDVVDKNYQHTEHVITESAVASAVSAFPEVPKEVINGTWEVVSSGRWDRKENIVVLEGRALVHALRHALRDSKTFGKRVLFISDNFSSVLALTKGRSSSRGLCRVARQWCAYSLAGAVTPYLRWIPSEWNPADAPSRRAIPIGVRLGFSIDGLPEVGSDPTAWPERRAEEPLADTSWQLEHPPCDAGRGLCRAYHRARRVDTAAPEPVAMSRAHATGKGGGGPARFGSSRGRGGRRFRLARGLPRGEAGQAHGLPYLGTPGPHLPSPELQHERNPPVLHEADGGFPHDPGDRGVAAPCQKGEQPGDGHGPGALHGGGFQEGRARPVREQSDCGLKVRQSDLRQRWHPDAAPCLPCAPCLAFGGAGDDPFSPAMGCRVPVGPPAGSHGHVHDRAVHHALLQRPPSAERALQHQQQANCGARAGDSPQVQERDTAHLGSRPGRPDAPVERDEAHESGRVPVLSHCPPGLEVRHPRRRVCLPVLARSGARSVSVGCLDREAGGAEARPVPTEAPRPDPRQSDPSTRARRVQGSGPLRRGHHGTEMRRKQSGGAAAAEAAPAASSGRHGNPRSTEQNILAAIDDSFAIANSRRSRQIQPQTLLILAGDLSGPTMHLPRFRKHAASGFRFVWQSHSDWNLAQTHVQKLIRGLFLRGTFKGFVMDLEWFTAHYDLERCQIASSAFFHSLIETCRVMQLPWVAFGPTSSHVWPQFLKKRRHRSPIENISSLGVSVQMHVCGFRVPLEMFTKSIQKWSSVRLLTQAVLDLEKSQVIHSLTCQWPIWANLPPTRR